MVYFGKLIVSLILFLGETHSGKISALPPWKWTYGEWIAVVVRIHLLQKWNAQTFLRKAKFHTEKEAKWTSKPSLSQKRLFDQSSFTIQMSLEVFQSNGNESRKILLFAVLTFISLISRYEILYAKYVDLLDKLKEVKKSQFFSTVQ
jgi:hypothetical protein